MASTTIYAPIVSPIQPAFTESGEPRVYFSLSEYNKNTSINNYLLCSITNNNQASAWGTTSLLNPSIYPAGYIALPIQSEDGNIKYIELPDLEYEDNQFYHIQLVLAAPTGIDLQSDKLTVQWLDANKDYFSLPSQTTLIRKIPEVSQVVIEGLRSDLTEFDYNLKHIKGFVEYESRCNEYIDSYYFSIGEEVISPIVRNTLGLQFETDLNYNFPKGSSIELQFHYTTISGYTGVQNYNIKINSPHSGNDNATLFTVTPESAIDEGAIVLHIKHTGGYSGAGTTLTIERTDETSLFSQWETLGSINMNKDSGEKFYADWYDFFVEAGIIYKYRITFLNQVQTISYAVEYADIFLSDLDRQLGIAFNPKVSGLKYVTQDSITNTLGGKYPLVRRNGETRYRQFSLSGSLWFHFTNSQLESTDSVKNSIFNFFSGDYSSLFLNKQEMKDYLRGSNEAYTQLKPGPVTTVGQAQYETIAYGDFLQRQVVYEKRMRDAALEFLTDGKVKLFRSSTEGNMFVYLSGVSFTPNTQLGRSVYDFSVTVTEICPYTLENFNLYGFNKLHNIGASSAYIYVLEPANSATVNADTMVITPYINTEQVISRDEQGYYHLVVNGKEVVWHE